ncbi:TerD family protein [Yinghuangia soli]|uniref:TerD family protein n=1 Tax=Yinghuangia soli TaxID=2908204 RepID=A0AA41Q116_9ACTN|nr:TerD family protein [Yinghuangia soli]MCF2528087.1 TerD family protein [Yinghuangia soli]
MVHPLDALVVRHTLRIPLPAGPSGRGEVAARQFDSALMSVGFKLSAELLERLSALADGVVVEIARQTLPVVGEMVGSHVAHNSYFIDFPANVPDTIDFWTSLVVKALAIDILRPGIEEQLSYGTLNLLTLPGYGTYQHTYAEMLAAHEELIPAAGDRVTVLHAGGDSAAEATALYLALAGSTTPLDKPALGSLAVLAGHCADGPQPEAIPVRENRAVVNFVRLEAGAELLVDTVTDVLRLACVVSDGDVALVVPTRFKSFPRRIRRALLTALDGVVAASPAKLADANLHREPFKRLGERLHPHEFPKLPHAAQVFAVARGELAAPTFDSRVEELLAARDVAGAARLLAGAPGRLMRASDRLLREARSFEECDAVTASVESAMPKVSGRVLLSLREHFANRATDAGTGNLDADQPRRIFVNRFGGACAVEDTRAPVPADACVRLTAAIDAEMRRRLPAPGHLLVDPEILDVAVPISGKATSGGFGSLPRGSVSRVDGELLRFFVYWKQTSHRTDYDLSALLLDEAYGNASWLSYTALTGAHGEHSGDITDAPDGASEFINLRLGSVPGGFIVPQVNIYSGESFEQCEESFFGFMLREGEQKGRPFEPRTVRMKSELRGPGRVALPLAFRRGEDGSWYAKWLHIYLNGSPYANTVEGSQASVAALLRSIFDHTPLTIAYLVDLLTEQATETTVWDGDTLPEGPVTYLGLERPAGLHPDSRVFTPENLRDLIPG